VAQLQSPLPNVVLVAGLLLASLLALAVHLAQTARFRAKQAELTNQELENEIVERQRTERLLSVQHATTRVLTETVTLGEATPKILQAICENLEWQLSELWSVDRKANVLRCVETWHVPSFDVSEFDVVIRQTAFSPGIGLPGRIWASGEPAWIADVVEDANFLRAASAAKEGLYGAFGIPILSGSEILGVIAFFSHKIQQPEEDLLQMMTDIGSQIGQFIERKRAEEALRKAHDELERRVEERTVELSKSNELLKQEINERKRAEEKITASLKEKEVLLKEIHHRVKNNLQVISSLLKLQCRSIPDKQTIAIFQESQNRIESMAFIHEQLYQSKNLSRIDFNEYICKLASSLFCAYEVSANTIALKINVDNVLLDIHAAIPCGLIINELVSNSLKYAFSAGKKGELSIGMRSDNDHDYTLIVADNGVGFPKDIDFQNTKSLGLQLVNALTDQLEGTIELNSHIGTEFKITFTR
jgi:two-component sensor histidine kinase